MPLVRTPEQIIERITAASEGTEDFFGFRREVLIRSLPFERAKLYLDSPDDNKPWDVQDVGAEAEAYLAFAIGKILNHRGISASRSVDKLREFAWLVGRDDAVAAIDDQGYAQYGAPKLRAFARTMGLPWPEDDAALARMADGWPCVQGCPEGCGQ